MTTQGNRKGLDEVGQEILLSSRGQQIMMQWEKQYMERCVDALAIQLTDRVLEIGFGLAYSSSRIQSFRPQSHTIIECDQETLQRAQQFAQKCKGVEIMSGTWQNVLPTLDQFDCVFFDDYPLPELEAGKSFASGQGLSRRRSRWHEFLDVVLKHCAAGARISGYLARELDLQRPGCQLFVSKVQVDVPEHCNYFPHKTALIPVITVTDPVVAAGTGDIGVKSSLTLPLPHFSRRFQRIFQRTSRPEGAVYVDTRFSCERRQIAEIREFLQAHEMDTFSRNQLGECNGGDSSDMSVSYVREMAQDGGQQVNERIMHYDDERSRREMLRTLRSKAAASKQVLG
ncbi:unnamed protein product [Peronospora destructor]|uniref:Uncharacterized protein n=1 Tax=Peronospora destructor TaxID=86335 RepID=A0AAV0T0C4_9STRA|nr:unnamed protein product [Peronospora destructor]